MISALFRKIEEKGSPLRCLKELELKQFSKDDQNDKINDDEIVVLFISNYIVGKDVNYKRKGQ